MIPSQFQRGEDTPMNLQTQWHPVSWTHPLSLLFLHGLSQPEPTLHAGPNPTTHTHTRTRTWNHTHTHFLFLSRSPTIIPVPSSLPGRCSSGWVPFPEPRPLYTPYQSDPWLQRIRFGSSRQNIVCG